jgi:hypothetical protein
MTDLQSTLRHLDLLAGRVIFLVTLMALIKTASTLYFFLYG